LNCYGYDQHWIVHKRKYRRSNSRHFRHRFSTDTFRLVFSCFSRPWYVRARSSRTKKIVFAVELGRVTISNLEVAKEVTQVLIDSLNPKDEVRKCIIYLRHRKHRHRVFKSRRSKMELVSHEVFKTYIM